MKLFEASWSDINYRHDYRAFLVASNEQEALEIIIDRLQKHWEGQYSMLDVSEVDVVDGYKIIVGDKQ